MSLPRPPRRCECSIGVLRDDMNRLRGRLFGAIGAVGLSELQENAIQGLIRQLTYDVQATLEATLRRGDTI